MAIKISNYRLSEGLKTFLKKCGKNNESMGIRFCADVVKKMGLKEARKLLEEK